MRCLPSPHSPTSRPRRIPSPLAPFLLGLALFAAPGCDPTEKPDETGDSPTDTVDTGETGTPPDEVACAQAEARLGYPVCVHRMPDEDTFNAYTVTSTSVDQLRVGKYMVPSREDSRIPGLFMNVSAFPMHYDLLVNAFPDDFAGLSIDDYYGLILYPETREFYAGTYSLYLGEEGAYYGFTVWDDPADASSTVTLEQVTDAWIDLQARFDLGPLSWVPNSSNQLETARTWDAPFDIAGLDSDVAYEVYNPGPAYGTLRLYTLDDLADATAAAEFGWQDILAIGDAPADLERVVSGIVTGSRQGTLSHLNVRSAARGTPNCYVKDVLSELAAWEGQLVRFECGEADWSVETATTDEAQAWWDSIRPEPVSICAPDLDEIGMPDLLELPTETVEERDQALCRYGAKGTNLATLYQRIDETWQLDGFLIPFHYYDAFIHENSWTVDLGEGEREYTFAETLDAWHADPTFLTDPSTRRSRLEALRLAMDDSRLDPELLSLVEARIWDVWGTDDTMVRFRSSSNAEDGLDFSGAGLYTSESGCIADDLDGDDDGPSLCDDDKDDEETVEDAILEVWASLWFMEAWDERDWYGIDQSSVVMGILADTRAKDEQANIVAFTGNPTVPGDDRYLVNAQLGEEEVVSTDPGIWPESDLLTVEDGEVTGILRVTASSEVDAGDVVLTDERLEELGAILYEIVEVYPQDDPVPEGHDVLWDTEWKIWSDGRLIVKQIRPYLR